MTVLLKNSLIALLIAGAILSLVAGVRSAAKVKVSETPKYTGPWGIPGQLDDLLGLWNKTLGYAIFGLALLGGAWLVSRTHWGQDVVWSGRAWTRTAAAVETAADFEVLEPRESWKGNLFWGCVMGLPFGLSALFAEGKWSAARAFGAALAFGFLLWMVQSAVENYSRTVRLSGAGLEERSIFGRRQVPWEEIGGLEFQDVREQIQRLQDWRTRRSSTLPRIDIWAVKSRDGREILSLPAGMQPDDAFRKMREQIEKRTSAR
jgi:hypothetical protein